MFYIFFIRLFIAITISYFFISICFPDWWSDYITKNCTKITENQNEFEVSKLAILCKFIYGCVLAVNLFSLIYLFTIQIVYKNLFTLLFLIVICILTILNILFFLFVIKRDCDSVLLCIVISFIDNYSLLGKIRNILIFVNIFLSILLIGGVL